MLLFKTNHCSPVIIIVFFSITTTPSEDAVDCRCATASNLLDSMPPKKKGDQAEKSGQDEKGNQGTKKSGQDKKKKKSDKEDWKEPKIKWKKSKAKRILNDDIINGVVPLEATDVNGRSTMKLEDIFYMHPEYAEYHYSKFSSRLSSLRTTIKGNIRRATLDQEAFDNYTDNHAASTVTARGGVEWQGSAAQELLLQDLAFGVHVTMSKAALHASRPEYYENFTLKDFRDRLNQELRTAKYLYTLKVRGKDTRK